MRYLGIKTVIIYLIGMCENFKNLIDKKYEIVLRLHPETLKRSDQTIKNINKKFKEFHNFEINLI